MVEFNPIPQDIQSRNIQPSSNIAVQPSTSTMTADGKSLQVMDKPATGIWKSLTTAIKSFGKSFSAAMHSVKQRLAAAVFHYNTNVPTLKADDFAKDLGNNQNDTQALFMAEMGYPNSLEDLKIESEIRNSTHPEAKTVNGISAGVIRLELGFGKDVAYSQVIEKLQQLIHSSDTKNLTPRMQMILDQLQGKTLSQQEQMEQTHNLLQYVKNNFNLSDVNDWQKALEYTKECEKISQGRMTFQLPLAKLMSEGIAENLLKDDAFIDNNFGTNGSKLSSIPNDAKLALSQAMSALGGAQTPKMQIFSIALQWNENLTVKQQMGLVQQLTSSIIRNTIPLPLLDTDDSGQPIPGTDRIPVEEYKKAIDLFQSCSAIVDATRVGSASTEKNPLNTIPARFVAQITGQLGLMLRDYSKALESGDATRIKHTQQEYNKVVKNIPQTINQSAIIINNYNAEQKTINGIPFDSVLPKLNQLYKENVKQVWNGNQNVSAKLQSMDKFTDLDNAIKGCEMQTNGLILQAAGLG